MVALTFPSLIKADSQPVESVSYLFDGSLTATGTDVCNPSPCTEIINLSFEWLYQLVPGDPLGPVPEYTGMIVGPFVINASGPLGTITEMGPINEYLGFFGGGAEIDLETAGSGTGGFSDQSTLTPFVPPHFGYDFYSCYGPCSPEFSNVSLLGYMPGPPGGLSWVDSVQQVAEPSVIVLTCLGAIFIGFCRLLRLT
jgi:hypothetical protein